jgi:hypothetical protein
MTDQRAALARCDEILASLASYGDDPKLRRLVADIEQRRDRLRAELNQPAETTPDSPAKAAS